MTWLSRKSQGIYKKTKNKFTPTCHMHTHKHTDHVDTKIKNTILFKVAQKYVGITNKTQDLHAENYTLMKKSKI